MHTYMLQATITFALWQHKIPTTRGGQEVWLDVGPTRGSSRDYCGKDHRTIDALSDFF